MRALYLKHCLRPISVSTVNLKFSGGSAGSVPDVRACVCVRQVNPLGAGGIEFAFKTSPVGLVPTVTKQPTNGCWIPEVFWHMDTVA